MSGEAALTLTLGDEAETIRLGEDLALALKKGTGSPFPAISVPANPHSPGHFCARLPMTKSLEVPSPTFTLVQSYELRIPVSHFDLYRLGDASELDELGFDEALSNGICLVEWPEVADDLLPQARIQLRLEQNGSGRTATITAPDAQMQRIRRVLAIREFLDIHGYPGAWRRFLTGDASTRAYETVVTASGETLILMDWPRPAQGPPVLDGKPYPKVAHLAEDPIHSWRSTNTFANSASRHRKCCMWIMTRASC